MHSVTELKESIAVAGEDPMEENSTLGSCSSGCIFSSSSYFESRSLALGGLATNSVQVLGFSGIHILFESRFLAVDEPKLVDNE